MAIELGTQDRRDILQGPLSQQLERVLSAWRGAHPEATRGDMELAFRSALADMEQPIEDHVPLDDVGPEDAQRVRWVTVVLALIVIVAMAAALLLIRRP